MDVIKFKRKGRLVLSRKPGESIEIEGDITIRVMEIRNSGAVRIEIVAPEDVGIMRSEIARKNIVFPTRAKVESDSDQVPAA
jgi:carbon storage regulator CsrA